MDLFVRNDENFIIYYPKNQSKFRENEAKSQSMIQSRPRQADDNNRDCAITCPTAEQPRFLLPGMELSSFSLVSHFL